ncbi:hypothetical protein [Nonomuraea sp. NPDC049480]|uniref:hypothetical protein n=1 Tax=Nonomuraea sp. NPDC049480 TaxID=3364353 RepID=UPI00379DB933
MLTVLMAFAACYGVLQLTVLGWGTRSVRVLTLVLAIGVGFYGCGMTAVLLQLACTRTLSALTGQQLYGVGAVAAYTIGRCHGPSGKPDNLCLNVTGTGNSSAVTIAACNGQATQRWTRS